jgi:hypothetical protein
VRFAEKSGIGPGGASSATIGRDFHRDHRDLRLDRKDFRHDTRVTR